MNLLRVIRAIRGRKSSSALFAYSRCIRLALVVLSVSLVLTARPAPAPARAQGERLVLAFYYAWYDETFWQKALSDQPTQSYVSTDPAAMDRHVAWAQQAGIDAFVQAWYGPQVEYNQTEPNFAALLTVAAQWGFQATVDFEVTSPFIHSEADVVAALRHLLTVHAAQPGFLRVGGKPVVFFWRQTRYPPETWVWIRDQVDPGRTSLWIAEGVSLDHMAQFDGHHLYSVAWDAQPEAQLVRWGQRVRNWSAQNAAAKIWVATVMPGYDDLVTDRPDAFVRDRAGGDYYRRCWDGAIQSSADWVIITSFNEWLEGSQIEPSVSYGNAYLDLTREQAGRYRAAPALPAATATSPPPPTATPPPSTATPTATPCPTPSATPTATPSSTPSPTATPSATPTATSTPTATATPRPTSTPLPPPTPLETAASFAWDYSGLCAGALALLLLVVALARRHRGRGRT